MNTQQKAYLVFYFSYLHTPGFSYGIQIVTPLCSPVVNFFVVKFMNWVLVRHFLSSTHSSLQEVFQKSVGNKVLLSFLRCSCTFFTLALLNYILQFRQRFKHYIFQIAIHTVLQTALCLVHVKKGKYYKVLYRYKNVNLNSAKIHRNWERVKRKFLLKRSS